MKACELRAFRPPEVDHLTERTQTLAEPWENVASSYEVGRRRIDR